MLELIGTYAPESGKARPVAVAAALGRAGLRPRWGVFGALVLLLCACASPPEEERLRTAIDRMQAAMKERRPAEFMSGVTVDFIGNDGFDRAALHNLLRAQLLRNAAVGATRGPTQVKLQGDRATVNFDVVLTGGAGGLLPERAQSYAITSGWRMEDGEWRVFFAEWKPAL